MLSIKPPNDIINYEGVKLKIFLAGSIEMGEAEDWQDEIIEESDCGLSEWICSKGNVDITLHRYGIHSHSTSLSGLDALVQEILLSEKIVNDE